MIKIPNNPNRLLTRQLKKSFPEGNCSEEQINGFIELVNDGYNLLEEDKAIYQRAEQISNSELQKTNLELQLKNDFLDTFNHGMAHDIKNHTSNIIGLINMLKKYTEKQNMEMIKEINHQLDLSANQLTSIVQGFLYLSRTESKVDSNYMLIDKDELIKFIKVETQFLLLGKQVNIDFKFDINELFFSRHILKIILVNLISNSIKYSKPNEDCNIIASLSHTDTIIELSVSDNGIGIDMENSGKKLYNLFGQGEKSEGKGFGVGLFLIKKIADRNNGEIKMESKLGVGTKVTVSFPIKNTK